MSPVRYALLSLLAREPLTGYDLTQRINTRIAPFWSVRYNQVYPELARLEEEGLLKHHVVEQETYRPAKKVYEMTPAGQETLRRWALAPSEPMLIRDEFLLKMYNLWLLSPEQVIHQLRDQMHLHVQQATAYEEHLAELKNRLGGTGEQSQDPLFASMVVLTHGLSYERHYVTWCQQVIESLEQERTTQSL